tara:strand:+ start:152 stop:763 length:612 start_codon:yes stop_codon:yes gene_type:complete
MNSYLKKVLSENKFTYEGKDVELIDGIPIEEVEMIYEVMSEYKPKSSLEIGLCHGISSMAICDNLKESNGVNHIIDPGLRINKYGINNLEKAGLKDNFIHYDDVSEVVLPQLLQDDFKVDFVFMDGWLTLDHLMLDFFYIDKILNIGGIVMFDNCEMSSVKEAFNYFSQYPSYHELTSYLYRCRYLIKESGDKRNWNWHTNNK